MWSNRAMLVAVLAASLVGAGLFAVGYAAGARSQRGSYSLANVGLGRVYRLNVDTGEMQLFNAACELGGTVPPPPPGFVIDGCERQNSPPR